MRSGGGTMSAKSPPHCVMFLALLLCFIRHGYGQNGSVSCFEAERQALLSIKRGLRVVGNITADPLPSWGNGDDQRDCCNWDGVGCSNRSGHVVRLYIYGSLDLEGNLSPLLSELRHLTSLGFSNVNLSGSQIPSLVGTLSHLRELYLTSNGLSGKIPVELGNLSRLETLSLSLNDLHGSIPETFRKLASLKRLNLDTNKLSGSIPDIFWNMSDLNDLFLGENMFEGEMPRSIWNLSSLTSLSVYSNKLHGDLPETMSRLNLLTLFDISDNLFQGEITEVHFTNLSMLQTLAMSSNSLNLNFHPNMTPAFRLNVISLGSCQLGPRFPKWLQTQTSYSYLNISNCGITDSIPTWFWYASSQVQYMDLSQNRIRGRIENHNISLQDAVFIYLNSNELQGSVPSFLVTQFELVNLHQNRFTKLNFSGNINNETLLGILDISDNRLSGELPDCWSRFKSLEYLFLSNNNLSGKVPSSFGSLNNIISLRLNKNNFTGELPVALKSCTTLEVVDFGENGFSGMIPVWLGKSLSNLTILSLRSNNFHGGIPSSLCNLSNLTVLDLSSNNIIGSIPNCINGFGAMKSGYARNHFDRGSTQYGLFQEETLVLLWKGQPLEFSRTLSLVRSIDLSSNYLSGEIPSEMSELTQLVSLNLSRNNLSGQIPMEFGRMMSLDSLDLSRNHLTGRIPQSLAEIDRMNTLNLSNNNLSGKIPTSTQLQSFQYAYWGNPELCGEPLPEKCPNATVPIPEVPPGDSDELLLHRGFYISIVIGFTTAFWGVCASLIFNKPFRYAYFKLWNDIGDWIYVKTAIQRAKVMRMIKG